jgi:hypothetical protein
MKDLRPLFPSVGEMDRLMNAAKQLRSSTLRQAAARVNSNLYLTKTVTGLLCAFAIAVGAFWVTMVTSPPRTQAALDTSLNPAQMERSAASDLPTFENKYQRFIGVLDTLAP